MAPFPVPRSWSSSFSAGFRARWPCSRPKSAVRPTVTQDRAGRAGTPISRHRATWWPGESAVPAKIRATRAAREEGSRVPEARSSRGGERRLRGAGRARPGRHSARPTWRRTSANSAAESRTRGHVLAADHATPRRAACRSPLPCFRSGLPEPGLRRPATPTRSSRPRSARGGQEEGRWGRRPLPPASIFHLPGPRRSGGPEHPQSGGRRRSRTWLGLVPPDRGCNRLRPDRIGGSAPGHPHRG